MSDQQQLDKMYKAAMDYEERFWYEQPDNTKSKISLAFRAGYITANKTQECESLKNALIQSVEVIKQWHSRSIIMAGKLRTVVDDVWEEYYKNAPEMKMIREALKEK